MKEQESSAEQALRLYAEQADAIRELLDEHAPNTTGNLQARVAQLCAALKTVHGEVIERDGLGPRTPLRCPAMAAYHCRECGWSGNTNSNCPNCAGEVTTASLAEIVERESAKMPTPVWDPLSQSACVAGDLSMPTLSFRWLPDAIHEPKLVSEREWPKGAVFTDMEGGYYDEHAQPLAQPANPDSASGSPGSERPPTK